MAEQLSVFVSHASEDSAFCHNIVAALRGAGADVWYDEHNLGSGRLADEILRELGRRPIFVVILSKHAFAWGNKGYALTDLKRYEEALADYDRALALDPRNAFAWGSKGNTLYALKRYEEALAAGDQALALDPSLFQAWYNKAITLRTLGRTTEAEAAEHRAKALGWKG